MEEDAKFSIMDLQNRSYRCLQRLAKSMKLPSNVKKVYLIQLIHAKKFETEDEVNRIIQQVKLERQHLAQIRKRIRKRRLKNREVSSTNLPFSPSISSTPKRPIANSRASLQDSPKLQQAYMAYNKRISNPSNFRSDRVLRSCNLNALWKTYGAVSVRNLQSKVPPHMVKSSNASCGFVVKNQKTSLEEASRKFINDGRPSKYGMTNSCIESRHTLSILNGPSTNAPRNENHIQYIVPHNQNTPIPAKRKGTLSGINPLNLQTKYDNFDHVQEVTLRHIDGQVSTINALVQRNVPNFTSQPFKHTEITIQDLINTIDVSLNNNIENKSPAQTNPVANDMPRNYNPITDASHENTSENIYSKVYHNIIRSEQIMCQETSTESEVETLPRINDVFGRFHSTTNRDVTQPLCVQVSDESQTMPNDTAHTSWNMDNSHMLESLYNFKSNMLTNAPLMQVATTSNTKCVYSTPLISTPKAEISSTHVINEPFFVPPCLPDDWYGDGTDLERQGSSLRQFEQNDDMSITLPPPLELAPPQVTISEMMEDAYEIISQDGDYMNNFGMDVRVQCVLCSWAGPKMILEFHIQKEHPSEIQKLLRGECHASFTMGALAHSRVWVSRALEYDATLYALSAKYEPPDCLMVTLTCLSSELDSIDQQGTITAYNKVTGEPHTWEGHIGPLPPNLPYENDAPCLKVELSKLDLMPNSAKLTLLNQKLVLKSPGKVVVGSPELSNIDINLLVRISSNKYNDIHSWIS